MELIFQEIPVYSQSQEIANFSMLGREECLDYVL
jgi:hypothetical protein